HIKPTFPRRVISDLHIGNTQDKLLSLLRDFKFSSIENIFFKESSDERKG
ncbi:unnamed protein product, partial [marine sediment metagenome]